MFYDYAYLTVVNCLLIMKDEFNVVMSLSILRSVEGDERFAVGRMHDFVRHRFVVDQSPEFDSVVD